MAQNIDIRFRDKAESSPLNKRFLDITGPAVWFGFRFAKGSSPFSVNLTKGGFDFSVAISPSGAKIEEDTDLLSAVTVTANTDPVAWRVDSIYMKYEYGAHEAVATYLVVPGNAGTSVPQGNPNPNTHTFLGYVRVPPNSVDLVYDECFEPVAYGFTKLNVAGPAAFDGPATFKKPVIFNAAVTFMDGSSSGGVGGGGGGASPSKFVRLPYPIVATTGQTRITLPSSYVVGTDSLFVFVDWVLQSPDQYLEKSSTEFEFYEPFQGSEKVWAFWVKGINFYDIAPHNHDDRYYTKTQMEDRKPRYFQDFMGGPTGKTLTHNLGHTNYVILGVTPTTRTMDAGVISVDKRANDMIVYNSGGYRGEFELSYIIKT